jgi:hypothetical protein
LDFSPDIFCKKMWYIHCTKVQSLKALHIHFWGAVYQPPKMYVQSLKAYMDVKR